MIVNDWVLGLYSDLGDRRGLRSLQLTLVDGTDKEFRNVVVSQPQPHDAGKPKNQEITFGTRRMLEDAIL